MNRKVQLAIAAAILTMLGAGEVSRRSCSLGVKATHGRHTLQEALVAPDETGAPAIEVLSFEDSPDDVRLTREVFKDAEVYINFTWLRIRQKQ
jgi:hypothetical protein